MAHVPFELERPNHRPARFAQRLKEELAEMIPGSLRDPRVSSIPFLTITDVTLSPDYKHANVLFCMLGQSSKDRETKDACEGLNKASTFLRRELMHRLNTKITPHLRFEYDKGPEASAEISTLFRSIE